MSQMFGIELSVNKWCFCRRVCPSPLLSSMLTVSATSCSVLPPLQLRGRKTNPPIHFCKFSTYLLRATGCVKGANVCVHVCLCVCQAVCERSLARVSESEGVEGARKGHPASSSLEVKATVRGRTSECFTSGGKNNQEEELLHTRLVN